MIAMLTLLHLESGVLVCIVLYQSLFSSTYVMGVEEKNSRSETRLHLVNELCVVVATYHILAFTQFVYSEDAQYSLGFSMVGITILNLLFNVVLLIKKSLSHLWRKYRLYKTKKAF